MSAPEPHSAPKSAVTVPRALLIVGGAVVVLLLVGVGLLIGVVVSGDGGAPQAASPVVTSQASAPPASQPSAVATPEPETYKVGDTITTGNVTLTIHSVEIVDSIETTSGEPLTPDPGGQLLLFKTTYSNSVNQADLSCGNNDLYIQVFDTEKREMAGVFETYRIPGNPGCNDHLLQDVPSEWNFAFQSVAGAKPLAMSITETVKWLDPVWIDLQP